MLFDLQGSKRRRRMVQVTFASLAILMGGGLVLFGIGGDAPGGLFEGLSGNSGGSDGNSLIQKRVDKNEGKLKANPRSEALRKALVRDYFQLATSQVADTQPGYPDDAKDELRKSAANWDAYLALEPKKPDTSLARLMLQVYDPTALAKPKEALAAARLIAENEEKSQAYLNLVQYAALAGDTRLADLAGQKAVDLSPKAERKAVKAQVKQLKASKPQSQTQTQGAGGAAQP